CDESEFSKNPLVRNRGTEWTVPPPRCNGTGGTTTRRLPCAPQPFGSPSMARTASPWFLEERNAWYVIKDGKRHLLGEHTADAPKPRRKKNRWVVPPTILDRYHELMAAKPEAPPAPKPTITS